jgi:hypothetical protein
MTQSCPLAASELTVAAARAIEAAKFLGAGAL